MKYAMQFRYSEEDEAYIAEAPELPGCMADGETPEKALGALKGVIASWIEAAKKIGRSIPEPVTRKPYGGKVHVRMPAWLHESLDQAATTSGCSLNQTIVSILSAGHSCRTALDFVSANVRAAEMARGGKIGHDLPAHEANQLTQLNSPPAPVPNEQVARSADSRKEPRDAVNVHPN